MAFEIILAIMIGFIIGWLLGAWFIMKASYLKGYDKGVEDMANKAIGLATILSENKKENEIEVPESTGGD